MSSNEKIVIDAQELLSQSESLRQLANDYEALFTKTTSIFHEMNDGWSENLANNFIGKISVAQKSFSKIVEMLGVGESVAKETATSFEDVNAVMARTIANIAGAVGNIFDNTEKVYKDPMGFGTYTQEEVDAAKARVANGTASKTDIRIANLDSANNETKYQGPGGIVYTQEQVDAAKDRIANGVPSLTDYQIAGATPIASGIALEALENAWDKINTGTWTKQDITSDGGFNLSGLGDLASTLASAEENIFGTNYIEGATNILNGIEEFGNQGGIFENSFDRLEEILGDASSILTWDGDTSSISQNMVDLISNYESAQAAFSEGNVLQGLLQGSVATHGYIAEELVSGAFGALEDNLNAGQIAAEFLGLGKYGDIVGDIQSGIENVVGMDISEIGDYLGTGVGNIYDSVGSAISGVGDLFEDAGSFLGQIF